MSLVSRSSYPQPKPLFRLDVNSSRGLQAVVLSLSQANREVRKLVRQQSQRVIQPEFQKAMNEQASTLAESKGLALTSRTQLSDRNVTLGTGTKKGPGFSGGLDPRTSARALEFGAKRDKVTTYKSKRKAGKTFSVTRHTQRQFKPNKRAGYVFYPVIAEMAPRILSLWTKTVVKTFHDAMEGKAP